MEIKESVSNLQVVCTKTFILTKAQPQLIFNGENVIDWGFLEYQHAICISNNCTDAEDCRMFIDIATFCLIEQLVSLKIDKYTNRFIGFLLSTFANFD